MFHGSVIVIRICKRKKSAIKRRGAALLKSAEWLSCRFYTGIKMKRVWFRVIKHSRRSIRSDFEYRSANNTKQFFFNQNLTG